MTWIGGVATGIVMAGVIGWEIGALADGCLRMILKYAADEPLKIDKRTYQGIYIYCIVIGGWIGMFMGRWEWYGQLACGVLAAYLLVASIQDIQTCSVYDFLHVAAVLPGLAFVLFQPSKDKILSLIVFLVVQIGLFMRMYGAADGLAFLVCAVFESRFGDGLLTYLLHMGAAYIVLGVVQGFRKNINKQGNLKEPVPFLPYIAATVWFFV